MKLHTDLPEKAVRAAMAKAKADGHVAPDVDFTVMGSFGSKVRDHAFEIQLGTFDKYSLPEDYHDQNGKKMSARRYSQSRVAGTVWAATWHEWGWFMLEVLKADPLATWGSKGFGYRSMADFHAKTGNAFKEASVSMSLPETLGRISGMMSIIRTEAMMALSEDTPSSLRADAYRGALEAILKRADRAEEIWEAYEASTLSDEQGAKNLEHYRGTSPVDVMRITDAYAPADEIA